MQTTSMALPRIEFVPGLLASAEQWARDAYPNESGGILMGTWLSDAHVVVTGLVGPGPKAVHTRYAYEADTVYERAQIASRYERSGRREAYLGDWHSHPGASHDQLSRADIAVLRKIASSSQARCPTPLMALLWGIPASWRWSCWWARPETHAWVWRTMQLDRVEHVVRPSASLACDER